ncbi:glucosaminidase domain-containing protein [Neolewinella aurantiaca]|nr:glucosaminidase domain-containing protein [Neolewinella aurantiaca]
MIKHVLTFLLFLGTLGFSAANTSSPEIILTSSEADQEDYIKRFKKIAMSEMERSGVPASIKLAQGILESDAGRSKLARSANNHFGIKCGSQWNGEEYYKEDDDYNDQGKLIKSCFRQYRNADASFVAHSEFLRDPAKSFRYGFLFRLDPTDYRAWAEGLRTSGYATNPNYPQLLISLIERYNLNQYDQSSIVIDDPEIVLTPVEELQRGILRTNDVSYFINDAPISVQEVARQVDVSVSRLLEYNENLRQENQEVPSGDRVYLQKKRRAYRGREAYHVTEEGEDLFDIAQRYGLRLDILARRNRLQETSDPATGEKVKLRGSKLREAPRLEGVIDETLPPTPTIPTDNNGQIIVDDPTDTPTTNPQPPYNPTPTTPTYPPYNPSPTPPTTTPQPVPPAVVPPEVANPNGPSNGTAEQYHAVSAGETLYAISRRYGLTVDALKQLNGLTGNNISIGQRLRVR